MTKVNEYYAPEVEHHLADLADVFRDPNTSNVHLQPGGHVWSGHTYHGQRTDEAAYGTVARYVASLFEEPLDAASPSLSCAPLAFFGGRWRVTILVPPITRGPHLTFRRITTEPFPLSAFALGDDPKEKLLLALQDRRGILIIGQQDSGKTSFATSLLQSFLEAGGENLRLALIEDTPEIHVPESYNHVALKTAPGRGFGELITDALRTSADLIIVGEVRDAAGVAHLMTAAVTGHGALTTFHAATAEIAYGRIAHLMQLAVHGLPDRDLIRAAFPVVVRLDHRRVTSILTP